jgi:hypothetical protein
MLITHHNSKLIAYVNSGIAPGSDTFWWVRPIGALPSVAINRRRLTAGVTDQFCFGVRPPISSQQAVRIGF